MYPIFHFSTNFSFFAVPNDDVSETIAVNTTTYDWEQNSTLTDAQASTITIQFTSIQKDITLDITKYVHTL